MQFQEDIYQFLSINTISRHISWPRNDQKKHLFAFRSHQFDAIHPMLNPQIYLPDLLHFLC